MFLHYLDTSLTSTNLSFAPILQMTSLCQQLLTLTSSRAVDHSSYLPEVVIQAVSPLVEQNAELQGQCQSLTKELEEV